MVVCNNVASLQSFPHPLLELGVAYLHCFHKDQLLCVLFEISIHKFGSSVKKSPNALRWSANIHTISERWKNMRKNCLEIPPDSPNVLLGQGSL